MILTVLGSGTCVPSLKRSSCSLLLEIGTDKLLCDIGSGTMRRLLENKTDISDISIISVSHFHLDHTGELASFLFSSKYGLEKPRTNRLTLIGGSGIHLFFDRLKAVYGDWIIPEPDLFEIKEIGGRKDSLLEFEHFTLKAMRVSHNAESIAIRVEDRMGNSVVYSGDTDYCEELIQIARKADVFICESSFPDDMKVSGHLTPSLAGDIAQKAGVGQLILTHFYPRCDQVNIFEQCRKTYTGRLQLAEDHLKIHI